MRSIASDDLARGPLGKTARHDDSPQSLYDHANRYFLSFVGAVVDRDLLPSAKAESQGDRQVLAQLIEIVAPDQAGRLSRELLEEFDSIGRILGQSEAALQRVLAGNEAVVKLLKATERFMLAKLKNELPRKLIPATDQRLVKYLQAQIGSRTSETMRILFLDASHHLLSNQEFGEGSPQRLYVQPRNILKRALELDASGLILVHNHPGGNLTPSQSDRDFTRSIQMLCRELGISVHDHIIITSEGWASFRKLKIL